MSTLWPPDDDPRLDESHAQKCPDPLCGDRGFSVHPDEDGDPEQHQCEFCYTNPRSLFNLSRKGQTG